MDHSTYMPGTLWKTDLHPVANGKALHITMTDTHGLSDVEVREHIVAKLGNLRDYMDEQAQAGTPRNCSVDHHAMQTNPHAVILRGDLRDLEHLKQHFDNRPRRHVAASPANHASRPPLRLVARDGVALV